MLAPASLDHARILYVAADLSDVARAKRAQSGGVRSRAREL